MAYFNFNRTKIVATVGPACAEKSILIGMIKAGVDVFRINFSHGEHSTHLEVIKTIREINKELGTTVAILGDLQGPKIRIGDMENGSATIKEGDELLITTLKIVGTQHKVYLNYKEFPQDVAKDDFILLDDGKLKLIVLETNGVDLVRTLVVNGGVLSSKKGVNLPNTEVSLPSLTEKDEKDLAFILENDLDWVALSFVRKATDVKRLREKIKLQGKDIWIISKIEKPSAVKNIDDIMMQSDGVMVARGDLGVEMPIEEVPLIQKMIVKKCKDMAKPVIVATQMMESMITSYMPTRAEANDVANAVLDGTDAVMLSAETSVGIDPINVVNNMTRIITSVETQITIPIYNRLVNIDSMDKKSIAFLSDSICYTAVKTAQHVEAKGIVSMTKSGYTAIRISSFRPKAQLFVFTFNERLLTRLSLVWGIRTFFYAKSTNIDTTVDDVNHILKDLQLVRRGDIIINTASMPLHWEALTNMIKLTIVD